LLDREECSFHINSIYVIEQFLGCLCENGEVGTHASIGKNNIDLLMMLPNNLIQSLNICFPLLWMFLSLLQRSVACLE